MKKILIAIFLAILMLMVPTTSAVIKLPLSGEERKTLYNLISNEDKELQETLDDIVTEDGIDIDAIEQALLNGTYIALSLLSDL